MPIGTAINYVPRKYKGKEYRLLYGLYEPEKDKPFWMGYGTYRRPNVHWNRFLRGVNSGNSFMEEKLSELKFRKLRPVIKIFAIYEDLEAVKLAERNAIKVFGKLSEGGTLCNITSNNSGATSEGIKRSRARPEVKARISAAMKIAQSRPEVNAKRSASLKLYHLNNPGVKKFGNLSVSESEAHGEKVRRGLAKAKLSRSIRSK